ncbi:glycosyltransferase involved in cell wall biosynthesis [Variovorax sp. TBS-050B]|uniref:VanW family protein n=1 Tax=Variovorax sp. TBS-050B TaxID=2940551 RepID=UPI0024763266|nr:VanW family protein [Variovorax sp. TBS-050B]MDH6592421.1 glycosyltransferase involved in cell wall biosynthesis [Variovorax sp. TBS-050B]
MSARAWQPPRRIDAIDFWLRARLLATAHALREALGPSARRWPAGAQASLADAPVLAQHRSPLWSDGRADEFPLVAGKVQNLRVARRAFDAVEVPAGELMSFWRQLGRPSASRGFVEGRELRGGCVVPTRAGGLCQLSNALATVAARAGFELVERHGHTARIEQAAPSESDAVDATVFWNYVDLKIRAPQAWRLEVALSSTELVLRIRGRLPPQQPQRPRPLRRHGAADPMPPVARGCLSCAQTDCFRHRAPADAAQAGRTAVLLDTASTPEFARYLETHHARADRLLATPVRLAFWRSAPGGSGPRDAAASTVQAPRLARVRRALWQRLWARHAGGRRQASLIDGQRWIAHALAARLAPDHTHLVVDQALLPHLQRIGALDGRRLTVLAAALPMAEIERRLDAAARRWPADPTLRDFRADAALVQAEALALARAEAIVTPHAEVLRHLARVAPQAALQRLEWHRPEAAAAPAARDEPPLVVFAASALARKGARELAAALQGLRCRLRVLGSPPEDARLWQGLAQVEHMHWRGERLLQGAAVAVLPAHVEHAPRALLRALAAGVPVVASTACGLSGLAGVQEVAPGDVAGLRAALLQALPSAPRATIAGAPATEAIRPS